MPVNVVHPTTTPRLLAILLALLVCLLAGPLTATAKPETVIRGHLVASAACPGPALTGMPEGVLSSRKPVPAEAAGRPYQVSGSMALVNSPKCLTWLSSDGKVLAESPAPNHVLGTGRVPQRAAFVVVQAISDVQSDYVIRVK